MSASRRGLFARDIESVIDVCARDPVCPFRSFKHDSNSFSFVLELNGKPTVYTFKVSDDYPVGSVLTCLQCSDQPEVIQERIPVVFSKMAKEHWKPIDLCLPDTNSIPDKGGGDASSLNSHNLMVIENDQRPHSPSSAYTDGTCDTDDTDYDDTYYMDLDDVEYYCDEEWQESSMHPLLAHDMEQVRQHFGPNAIDGSIFSDLQEIDVDLNVDVSFLEDEISKAWCISRCEPIVVRLHCSLIKYLDTDVPKVEVFQPSRGGPSGICSQLRKIAESLILKQWKLLSNNKVQSQLKKASQSPSNSPSRQCSAGDRQLSKLVDLGVGIDSHRSTLHMSQGFVDEAANLLILRPELSGNAPTEGSQKKPSKWLSLWPRSSSVNGQPVTPPGTEDLHLIPAATQNGKNAKVLPTLEHGFLCQLYNYVRNRIPTLSEFCVVCDEQHVFQNGAMLKPAVCERELCVFSYQNIGVMQDAAENIASGAEVVDLLVAMVASSIRSSRRHLIFDPYPMVVDPRNPKEFAFTPKKKNYERIQQALDSFISIREMLATGSTMDVKRRMDTQDCLAYPLLQWIISSNRSHIVKLPEQRQIRFMHTPHQFLLLSSPPAKEAAFRKAKMLSGSTFAFHGSQKENWHSILRHGLINASGTKHQMHGAVYGKGIYLSPHSSVSFGYSGMGHGIYKQFRKLITTPASQDDSRFPLHHNSPPPQSRFLQSKELTCIALCEVVNSKDLTKHGHVWVCTNPDLVCTRFFFVYEDGKVGDQAVDTTQEKYTREIINAMADCSAP